MNKIIKLATNTIIASIKSTPPSAFDSIPIIVMCESIAPNIKPNDNKAPKSSVALISNNTLAINSITPVAILPHGSTPNFVNSSTDSGAAVNLKNSVCTNIIATIIRSNQDRIFINFTAILFRN